MNPQEWSVCLDPRLMLQHLAEHQQGGERRHLLFSIACCRMIAGITALKQNRKAITAAEQYTEGKVPWGVICAECDLLDEEHRILRWLAQANAEAAARAIAYIRCRDKPRQRRRLADLVRDIFGNPFCPAPVIDPYWLAWNEGTVLGLAKSAYEDRQFPAGTLDPTRLAMLADALTDAGCDAADILSHLRDPGLHVRGCWPVDAILAAAPRSASRRVVMR